MPKKLSYNLCDPKGIPLNFLILTHNQYNHPNSLKENLGDAYLYVKNPIFRNIRNEYLRRGFRFTVNDVCNSQALPMMAIDDFIAAGKIPYIRNVRSIIQLQKIAPNKFTCTEMLRLGLKCNYLLHESAHLIAHDIFFGTQSMESLPKNKETLLQILLGESFANCAEALSSIYAQKIFDTLFLKVNCYSAVENPCLQDLLNFAQKNGFTATAKVLFASFIYSNYLYQSLDKAELEQIRIFAELKRSTNIDKIAKIAFSLSINFRMNTTPLHLLKIGFDKNLPALLDSDPLKLLMHPKNKSIHKKVNQLIQIMSYKLGSLPKTSSHIFPKETFQQNTCPIESTANKL